MRLNHLQLMVGDVAAASAFLAGYFGLTAQPGDDEICVRLTDEAGTTLILIEGQDHAYPKSFRLGFVQPDEAAVERLWQRLEQDGQQPVRQDEAPDGAFDVMAPGGMMIEVLGPSSSGREHTAGE